MQLKNTTPQGQRVFDVLRVPVVTEKSTQNMSQNRYVFKVSKDATKPEIKAAVESIFKVKVHSINTLNQEGKKKHFRRRLGRRSSYKKASVRLMQGNSIDTGVKI